jgi:hypothetical protein
VAKFISALYKVYVDLYFTYLEINPLVITAEKIYILDLAAKVADDFIGLICFFFNLWLKLSFENASFVSCNLQVNNNSSKVLESIFNWISKILIM